MKFSIFFSNVQEAPWYRQFLDSVVNEIKKKGNLLDIGTGTGKLIQILSTEKEIICIGVDTNSNMLIEAEKKLRNTNAKLLKINPNLKLPFKENSFDYITICNVLFHLKKESIDYMIKDALRLLKKEGKIIILTPTGKGNLLILSKNYFSIKNLSIYIWFYATRNRAGPWTKNKYLEQYSNNNSLHYTSKIVMNGLAQIEIILK